MDACKNTHANTPTWCYLLSSFKAMEMYRAYASDSGQFLNNLDIFQKVSAMKP